jgi:hypothetical protein
MGLRYLMRVPPKGSVVTATSIVLEEARRRFAHSLVGSWSTAVGTFGSVIDQRWEIRADGTGQYTDTGPFGTPRLETHFEWRQNSKATFELRLVRRVALQPGDEPEPELDDEERQWQTIRYDFIMVNTDTGSRIGMIDVSQLGREFKGFLDSLAPLTIVN